MRANYFTMNLPSVTFPLNILYSLSCSSLLSSIILSLIHNAIQESESESYEFLFINSHSITETATLKVLSVIYVLCHWQSIRCIYIYILLRLLDLSAAFDCTVSVKKIPPTISDIFRKQLGIFSPNFARLLYVPIYAGLQIFTQLPATLTKLCHINPVVRWWWWLGATTIICSKCPPLAETHAGW